MATLGAVRRRTRSRAIPTRIATRSISSVRRTCTSRGASPRSGRGWWRGGGAGGKTLVVSVPSFAETGTVALVNLDTLECHPVSFSD